MGRPNGHYDAWHKADKHWDSIISIALHVEAEHRSRLDMNGL